MGKVATILATATALATGASGQGVSTQKLSFESGGKRIAVEMFHPGEPKRAPALLVVHGAGGMHHGNSYVRQLATAFAGNGYATLLVHYFDRTGTTWAGDSTIHTHFEKWLETIGDAITFTCAQPGIDAERVAIIGYSLGGYLAVAQAARDRRVAAVVELAGGIDPTYAKTVKRMPPTLIVHGKSDQRVDFERALELERLLKRLGTPVATRHYPKEGHILSPVAALDALGTGLEFLREHLR